MSCVAIKSSSELAARREAAFPDSDVMSHCFVSKSTIKNTIIKFLKRCDTPCTAVQMPDNFKKSCIEEAINLGYPLEECDTLQAYFQGGALMAYTGYAHRELSVKMYIARYTATVLYLDDHFKLHYDGLLRFNERFLRNDHQEDKIFQCLSMLLLEMPQHFNPIASNLITVSTFNFIASLIIEHDTADMKAFGYAGYSRRLSGLPESFAVFIFARDCPVQSYVQALPEMFDYLAYANDILSFYKEELLGDTANYISLYAACHNTKKDAVFRQLSDECATAYEGAVQILQCDREAYEAWLAFCRGYVSWHASLRRYRLEELGLTPIS